MKCLSGSSLLTVLAFLVGCTTGSATVTGAALPAIDPATVKIYLEAPSDYRVVGIVEASSEVEFSSQSARDRTVQELKEQAAKIGANGVLVTDTGQAFTDDGSEVKTAKAKAIVVERE